MKVSEVDADEWPGLMASYTNREGKGWDVGGGRKKRKEERGGNAQVIPQYPRTENAYGEEVTTQTSIATETASDCLVVEFFNVVQSVRGWS